MDGLALRRHSYQTAPQDEAFDVEPVIVTPSRNADGIRCGADRNGMFAGHCAFFWHQEKVLGPTDAGGRPLAYHRLKQMAVFDGRSLRGRIPRQSDRLTRSWDAAEFEVVAVSIFENRIVCDLAPIMTGCG